MICIEIADTGERLKIEHEVWVTDNRNGLVIAPERCKAKAVGDGERVWSLGELEGYPKAKLITLAEYEETMTPQDDDPELTAEEALTIIMGGNL